MDPHVVTSHRVHSLQLLVNLQTWPTGAASCAISSTYCIDFRYVCFLLDCPLTSISRDLFLLLLFPLSGALYEASSQSTLLRKFAILDLSP